MSVSPPCASPLERVQSTRARFVRAKPDPVLRFDSREFHFEEIKPFVFCDFRDRVVIVKSNSHFPALSECSLLFLPLKPNICQRWEKFVRISVEIFVKILIEIFVKIFSVYDWANFVKVGDYMHKVQRDLVPSHRKIVTDWMLEVGVF